MGDFERAIRADQVRSEGLTGVDDRRRYVSRTIQISRCRRDIDIRRLPFGFLANPATTKRPFRGRGEALLLIELVERTEDL
jgi:hypothetical protein